jgi:protocatechuate 3,4-dioxygenase beta subunit
MSLEKSEKQISSFCLTAGLGQIKGPPSAPPSPPLSSGQAYGLVCTGWGKESTDVFKNVKVIWEKEKKIIYQLDCQFKEAVYSTEKKLFQYFWEYRFSSKELKSGSYEMKVRGRDEQENLVESEIEKVEINWVKFRVKDQGFEQVEVFFDTQKLICEREDGGWEYESLWPPGKVFHIYARAKDKVGGIWQSSVIECDGTVSVVELVPQLTNPGRIEGKITDKKTGVPLPGAEVEVKETGKKVTADPVGRYKIEGLLSGTYTLIVTYCRYEEARRRVVVKPGEVKEENFALVPIPARIKGKITDRKTGRALRGAEVVVEGDPPIRVSANEEGRYEIDQLSPGSYTLMVSHRGYQKVVRRVEVEAGEVKEENFALVPIPARIKGKITDRKTGRALRGAEVVVERDPPIRALADEEGRYEINQLSPGSYTLMVSHPGYQRVRRRVEVEAGEVKEENFALVPIPARIEGRITDRKTGRPLRGARVVVREVSVKVFANGDGRYEIGQLSPGSYTLMVSYPRYQSVVRRVEVEAGQLKVENFALVPTSSPRR